MIDAALKGFCDWLAATSLSNIIQTQGWMIPTLQTIHILSVAVLFSSAILVDLRIWRLLERDVPLAEVARRFLPSIWPIVLILLVTGSLLIVAEPRRSLLNSTFYLKMALLAVAMVLTAALQWSLASSPNMLDKNRHRRLAERFAALASILVWSGILFAGRWIAYTQAG
ncbi:MAG: hypothetical protein QOF22_488 [Bradyrhizobium sp.]|jgi:uncharacterized membrane protein|nr:hypothetical protein [Bradyrhizobium sp.]